MTERLVSMSHGGGGTRMQELLQELIFPLLGDELLAEEEDAAALSLPGERVAVTTDSFVVSPLVFPGGDIGKLSVCGTVNDLAMRGATPMFITLGLILEEGLSLGLLERAISSIRRAADEAQVRVIAGDTKVVQKGQADGMYINTAGLGTIEEGREVSIRGAAAGDVLLLNGYIGDHGIAVMNAREHFFEKAEIVSDCAPLAGLVKTMLESGAVNSMRDPTRGGLAAVLKEMARASACSIVVEEAKIPVREQVAAACELLGLDPLYVANEGKLVAAVPETEAEAIIESMKKDPYGRESRVIGRVTDEKPGEVSVLTDIGTHRLVRMPSGEQLPRIC